MKMMIEEPLMRKRLGKLQSFKTLVGMLSLFWSLFSLQVVLILYLFFFFKH